MGWIARRRDSEKFNDLAEQRGYPPPGWLKGQFEISKARTGADFVVARVDAHVNVADRTRADYKRTLECYIQDTRLGDTPIDRATKDDVIAWVRDLQNKGLATKMIRGIHALLSTSLAEEVDRGTIPKNPAKRVAPKQRKNARFEVRDRDEAAAFLKHRAERHKLLIVGTVALASAASFFGAVPAAGEGLGGISGWQPAPKECGEANIVPLLVGNYTTQTQTGSITIDGNLAEQVTVTAYAEKDSGTSNICPPRNGDGPGQGDGIDFQENFTIAPGQVAGYVISLGGVDENLIGANHTFSIGGLPAGVPNAQWYDFQLSLGGDGSFSSLSSFYAQTGGTDSSTNLQSGFNILSCSPSTLPSGNDALDGTNVSVTGPIASPYSATTVNGPTYGWNQPMCLGWLPDGQYITDQAQVLPIAAPAAISSVDAVQYQTPTETMSLVANAPQQVTGVRVETPGTATSILLPSTPSAGGFWLQNDGKLIIEGVPAYETTTVTITGPNGAMTVVSVDTPATGQEQPVQLPTGVITATATSSVPWASMTVEVGSVTFGPDAAEQNMMYAGTTMNLEISGADFAAAFPDMLTGAGEIVLQSATLPNGTVQQYNNQVIAQAQDGNTAASTGSYTDTVQIPVPAGVSSIDYTVNFAVVPGTGPTAMADAVPFTMTVTIDTSGFSLYQ